MDPAFGSTEYLESGAEISADEETVFVEKVFPLAIANSAVVTISGSVPKGASSTVYKRLIEDAKADGKIVLLDTSGAQLKESLSAKPFLVKPNVDELEMLFETKIKSTKEIVEYAHKIRNYGIPNVMISMGSKGALLSCDEGDIVACPPAVEVVNTVGCGDSMLGAFAVAVIRAMSAEESIRYAVAVGTANALSPSTGSFDMNIREEIFLMPDETPIDLLRILIWYDWEHEGVLQLATSRTANTPPGKTVSPIIYSEQLPLNRLLLDWADKKHSLSVRKITRADYLEWMLQWPPRLPLFLLSMSQ